MKITFINVGYGEAILFELGDKEGAPRYNLLVDGGSGDALEYDGYEYRTRAADYLNEKGIRKIDLLINTHIHEDHTCGLSDIVKHVEIGEFWCNYDVPNHREGIYLSIPSDSPESLLKFISAVNNYNEIYFALKKRGVPIRQIYGITRGKPLHRSLSVDILGPSEQDYWSLQNRMEKIYSGRKRKDWVETLTRLDAWMNMTSIILRFNYQGVRILLPADVTSNGFGHLKDHQDLLRADIFKTAHHGQPDGISAELAGIISPKIVVTCASGDHRYDSSNEKTYETIAGNVTHSSGDYPIFLFQEGINVKGYSEDISPRRSVVIEINRNTSEITGRYI